jgi:DNA-binding CsgD family transcriptional regulator
MRLLAAGAICIAKDASAAEIIDTIHRAANSEIPHFGANGAVAGERYFTGLLSLTPRELEVLGCLSDGQTHKQIADALQISLETARTHTERIRRKLAVRTNRELIGALWWSRT